MRQKEIYGVTTKSRTGSQQATRRLSDGRSLSRNTWWATVPWTKKSGRIMDTFPSTRCSECSRPRSARISRATALCTTSSSAPLPVDLSTPQTSETETRLPRLISDTSSITTIKRSPQTIRSMTRATRFAGPKTTTSQTYSTRSLPRTTKKGPSRTSANRSCWSKPFLQETKSGRSMSFRADRSGKKPRSSCLAPTLWLTSAKESRPTRSTTPSCLSSPSSRRFSNQSSKSRKSHPFPIRASEPISIAVSLSEQMRHSRLQNWQASS